MGKTDNTLEFEWTKDEKLYRVGRGTIETPQWSIDFVVKDPNERVDDHPIEVFAGFTDGIAGADRITNAYAEAGRLAMTMNYPRLEDPRFVDDQEGHKVETGMLVLAAVRSLFPDLQEADAQGHSQGGPNASRACLENPEEFRTLVVMASAGLIKNDSKAKITRRALVNRKSAVHMSGQLMKHPLYNLRLAASSAAYVRKNLKKADRESNQTGSSDIRHRFPVLSKKRYIPNGALQFESDALFPLDMVLESTDNGSIFDILRVYPEADATHVTPQIHPRTTASIVLEMTAELVEIRQKLLVISPLYDEAV